jgi:hypothetical protein
MYTIDTHDALMGKSKYQQQNVQCCPCDRALLVNFFQTWVPDATGQGRRHHTEQIDGLCCQWLTYIDGSQDTYSTHWYHEFMLYLRDGARGERQFQS